jgi:CYTH domain-containing protein
MSVFEPRVETVFLGGGPCGGKTACLPFIKKAFENDGWLVLISSEVPTRLMYEHGYVLDGSEQNISPLEFQNIVLGEVLRQEEALNKRAIASGHSKVLIVCDRGRFDGSAYIDRDTFFDMARTIYDQSKDDLYGAYAGGVFLTSLAVDKPELFLEKMGGNVVRRESTPEPAIERNYRSLDACVGVSRLYVVDNSTDFEGKVERVIAAIRHMLDGKEIERKYTFPEPLTKVDVEKTFRELGVHYVSAHISQAYLVLTDEDRARGMKERRIRGMTFGKPEQCKRFYSTLKGAKVTGQGAEEESSISRAKYVVCFENDRDPMYTEVVKTRYYFVYDGRYFELDVFESPYKQAPILECELLPGDDPQAICLPEFFGELVEVTEDPAYSNRNIALKK